jgi:hydroxymethylglutaryl-CoA lyase
MSFPKKVTLVEVGPRDGLQNEPSIIPTEIKLAFIEKLSKTGLTVIEATSFVSPKWIPQMADHQQIMENIPAYPGITYPALVPNLKGLEAALKAKVKTIAVFTAASETFSKKNTNCSIAESLKHIEEIILIAKQQQIAVRAYISCVLVCPYEGEISAQKVAEIAKILRDMGCYEISLGDTIGVGTPKKAQHLIETVSKNIAIEHLAVHFHDTYGQALANIYACLELGIATIDSSAGGLGGCPYAPGASGNVATEDVLYLLNGLGIETGVDLKKLMDASFYLLDYLKRPTRSRVAQALHNKGL